MIGRGLGVSPRKSWPDPCKSRFSVITNKEHTKKKKKNLQTAYACTGVFDVSAVCARIQSLTYPCLPRVHFFLVYVPLWHSYARACIFQIARKSVPKLVNNYAIYDKIHPFLFSHSITNLSFFHSARKTLRTIIICLLFSNNNDEYVKITTTSILTIYLKQRWNSNILSNILIFINLIQIKQVPDIYFMTHCLFTYSCEQRYLSSWMLLHISPGVGWLMKINAPSRPEFCEGVIASKKDMTALVVMKIFNGSPMSKPV